MTIKLRPKFKAGDKILININNIQTLRTVIYSTNIRKSHTNNHETVINHPHPLPLPLPLPVHVLVPVRVNSHPK